MKALDGIYVEGIAAATLSRFFEYILFLTVMSLIVGSKLGILIFLD